MSGYERPSARSDEPQAAPARPLTWWAMLSRPQEHGAGETLVSPTFRTQHEMADWIRAHRDGWLEVCPYRREPDGRDVALHAREPKADPARVEAILNGLRRKGNAA